MYKFTSIIAVAALLTACGSADNNGAFELKGTLSNTKGEMLYLEKLSAEQPIVVDSTSVDGYLIGFQDSTIGSIAKYSFN